ncbi:uncharacterized protein LOC143211698 [Lasioglossum baleicum]|uniref:uncharacterized protein LOC143211698 n=1 Tax=Lasioglossum baleicum TaxID=434251 RepID=UPI003FCE74C2
MNDSFLEDVGLVPEDTKNSTYQIDRNVTTRTATSSPLQQLQSTKGDNLNKKIEQTEKQLVLKDYPIKESRKLLEQDARKQQIKVKMCEKKERMVSDSKLKPIENKVKPNEKEIKDDIRARVRETKVRIAEGKVTGKERTRRSGSCKEINQTWDVSAKENRPSDGSKEGASQVDVPKERARSHEPPKTSDTKELDSSTLLEAIKDIVSTHTKEESSKILGVMQKLHFRSQANLIKHILDQTDEITNEIRPSKDSSTVRSLMEQNERLKEDIVFLQKQNVELQKKVQELELLKQENLTLKLKCKELLK